MDSFRDLGEVITTGPQAGTFGEGMFDIEMIDEPEFEGYKIINPEGEEYLVYRVSREWSPGYYALLAEAEEKARETSEHRSVLEQEAALVYRRKQV